MRNRDTDHGGFAYLLDDIGLYATKSPGLDVRGNISHYYAGLGLEPSWQAPPGYDSQFGVSIPVSAALAIPESAAESELVASLAEPTTPLIRKEAWVVPQDSLAGSIAQAGPALAILASFIAGIMLLLLYRHILEKQHRRILVHLLGGLFLAIVVPVALAFENSARAGELAREQALREKYELQATAKSKTRGFWSDRELHFQKPWESITPVRYSNPELATVVLMHGIIGHALYYINEDVSSLAQLQLTVGIPGVEEYTPGMKYALAYYGLDGWGREFRMSTGSIAEHKGYRYPAGRRVTLESAGADGRFGTADDFILTTIQSSKQMYHGGFDKQRYNHYAPYIDSSAAGLIAYLPGYARSQATKYPFPSYFSLKHVAPPSHVNEYTGALTDYSGALGRIHSDYAEGGADGLALHLYGMSRSKTWEDLYGQRY
jgi:hypothetical protein